MSDPISEAFHVACNQARELDRLIEEGKRHIEQQRSSLTDDQWRELISRLRSLPSPFG